MFGFVYLGWALISHIGYKTKELFYNALAPVDKHTNTYWGYDGHEYVAGTNKRVPLSYILCAISMPILNTQIQT